MMSLKMSTDKHYYYLIYTDKVRRWDHKSIDGIEWTPSTLPDNLYCADSTISYKYRRDLDLVMQMVEDKVKVCEGVNDALRNFTIEDLSKECIRFMIPHTVSYDRRGKPIAIYANLEELSDYAYWILR